MKEKSIQETLCHLCQKNFSSVYKLKTHLKIHEGKLDFKCSACLKKFVSVFALNKHNLTHEKSFQCDICEKTFSRKDNLQIHIQNHLVKSQVVQSNNMIVEFICSFCHQHFMSKSDLLNHFDLACNKHCQEQLHQEVIEYPISRAQNQIDSDMIFTQVVESEITTNKVFAEIVDSNAEIILVDNNTTQEVLIIEEPVVYI